LSRVSTHTNALIAVNNKSPSKTLDAKM